LDGFTVNRIAAGEVVERPASVVKELVENSIDAGSTAITIDIQDGGIAQIRVTDNGTGMEGPDAVLSFERHATSKISNSDDLSGISTLGFRGEALASIAAVSRMEMITRPKNQLAGTLIVNNGGNIVETRQTGCPEGTTIIVRNLFFNTPARLKFLKSIRTETAAVSDLTARLIMANPNIAFKYLSNGKIVYNSPGNGKLHDAILSVYGREVCRSLVEIGREAPEYRISVMGYIGNPSLARTNRNHQSFFVNDRYIKSALISGCLEEAYKTGIMANHFPWAVLHIKVQPDAIDVNVHPAKTEIRFRDEAFIKDILSRWFQEAIHQSPYVPSAMETDNSKGPSNEGTVIISRSSNIDAGAESAEVQASIGALSADGQAETATHLEAVRDASAEGSRELKQMTFSFKEQGNAFAADESRSHAKSNLKKETGEYPYAGESRTDADGKKVPASCMKDADIDNTIDAFDILPVKVIGTAFSTYILAEGKDNLYIIDQHAAHERLLYERLKEMVEKQSTVSQQLLPPLVLEVLHNEYITIMENMSAFSSLGFEMEPFGGNAFIIRGIPAVLKGLSIIEFFNRLLDFTGSSSGRLSAASIQQEDIMLMSCKMAVKANDRLTEQEITGLVRDINSKKIPLTCPHGRPILIAMSRYELEKKFKRIV